MKNLKKILCLSLALVLLLPSLGLAANGDFGTTKNVILLIPDGMSVEAVTSARWMTDSKSFTFDQMATGLVRTNNSNTPIADSAPAGTAMATGIKTVSPFIGTYPTKALMPGAEGFDESKSMMPIANVLEGAHRKGMATGIIATSQIQHATPADFSAHHPNRNNYEDLAEQQVYQNIDVVLGGGSRYLSADSRKDGEDLISVIKGLGYDYVEDTAAMKASTGNKLWGMFAPKAMSYDIDRDPAKEPSLAEMTSKAIDVLSKNKDGFFLMVEGSQIDWAAHDNDPVGIRSEVIAFDKAVAVAKE
ncbi:MAG: alkaline phosphatase, partial [Bacillota bacterium]|nr:alkaline phosphatase [Bacillota bacterium]